MHAQIWYFTERIALQYGSLFWKVFLGQKCLANIILLWQNIAFHQPPRWPDGTGGSGGHQNRPGQIDFSRGSPSDCYHHYGRPPGGFPRNGSNRQPGLHLDFSQLSIANSHPPRQQPQPQQQHLQQGLTLWVEGGGTRSHHHPQLIRMRVQNFESTGILSIADQTYEFSTEDICKTRAL